MPNWCDNQITITGDKSVIDKIEKIVKEEDKSDIGLLQFMYPMPKELDDTTSDSSSAGQATADGEGFDTQTGTVGEQTTGAPSGRSTSSTVWTGKMTLYHSHSVQPGHHRLVLIPTS